MTDYERGLADAAAICRRVARDFGPVTSWRWSALGIPRTYKSVNIGRRGKVLGAIRCARSIESASQRQEG